MEESGLKRMIAVALSATVLISCTYLTPGLEDFRPWIEGDAIPFSIWWSNESNSEQSLPGFNSGVAVGGTPDETQETLSKDLLAEIDGNSNESNPPLEEVLVTPTPTPLAPTKSSIPVDDAPFTFDSVYMSWPKSCSQEDDMVHVALQVGYLGPPVAQINWKRKSKT